MSYRTLAYTTHEPIETAESANERAPAFHSFPDGLMRMFLSMGMGGFHLSPWLLLLAEAPPTLPDVDRPSLMLWLSLCLRLPHPERPDVLLLLPR